MAEKIRVKPADGLTVPHPETGVAMKECDVERTPAIIRLLRDKDLIQVRKADKKAPAKKKAKPEK